MGSCLREYFGDDFKIKTQDVGQTKTLSQSRRINIHHHVDQRLELSGFSRSTDVLHLDAQVIQEWLGFINSGTISGQHQEKLALTSMRHARSHRCLDDHGAEFSPFLSNLHMNRRANRGAIDKQTSGRVRKKIVFTKVNLAHRGIVGDYREYGVS